MALPATDDFTTGSDQSLTDYSANWTNALNSFYVLAATDDVHSNDLGNECGAFWNADAFNANQYAQGKFKQLEGGQSIGLAVRASANNYYGGYSSGSNDWTFEVVAGGWNQIATVATGADADEVGYLEIDGEDLTYKIDSVTRLGPTSDDSLSSGAAGLCGYYNSALDRIDDWEGGNLAGESASVSPSVSPSPSASVSPSVSPSSSKSPSVSPSPSSSPSASISPSSSESASISPSAAPLTAGEVCWGHDTDVLEANVRDFSGNWTGTGTVVGAGDAEVLELNAGENMVSEVVNTGAYTITLLQNEYDITGDDVTLEYRHGISEAACLIADYIAYEGSFTSLGYVQIRVTSTL